ncbi:hypothetical protein NQ314_001396 [Rhamnusium bicolor]|uniref:Bardet-Biedl syndrome 1 N-terminal domain-containing protein n=1 Tax=Rhamnusium bicolor TaxID=1586634 RepID=A0AAV8ZSP3_9CUCU|nr:hypothetical protein NQ314_001396 [Rhamnusium bicolor]
MSRGELNISRWLEAHSDRTAGVTTLPRNAELVDVAGDGDYRLVITDLNLQNDNRSRLKVYKGSLTSDIILPDVPNSLITFYPNQLEPRIPAVAVACGSDLFIYKNNKPFYKFRVPSTPILPLEAEFWKKCHEDEQTNSDIGKAVEELKALPFDLLSSRQTHAAKKATPFIMKSIGLFDVEYRIVVACREGHICILRRGWLEGKSIIQMIHNIIDIVIIPGDNFIVVATADKMLNCYTKRGQNLWSTKMTSSATCLCLVPLHHLGINLVAVGLRGGAIHLYQGRYPVDYTTVPDTPSVITFGQLGQEENVMVVITLAGTMTFKILKRTADFNLSVKENVPILQSTPLPLPKRSKLFLEQSLREKQTALGRNGENKEYYLELKHLKYTGSFILDMHQKFQQDLIRLRLTSARELVSNVTKQSSIGNDEEQIKLTARVPLMPPSFPYKMSIQVEEILSETSEEQQSATNLSCGSIIRVYIIKGNHTQPILAATVNMPSVENI